MKQVPPSCSAFLILNDYHITYYLVFLKNMLSFLAESVWKCPKYQMKTHTKSFQNEQRIIIERYSIIQTTCDQQRNEKSFGISSSKNIPMNTNNAIRMQAMIMKACPEGRREHTKVFFRGRFLLVASGVLVLDKIKQQKSVTPLTGAAQPGAGNHRPGRPQQYTTSPKTTRNRQFQHQDFFFQRFNLKLIYISKNINQLIHPANEWFFFFITWIELKRFQRYSLLWIHVVWRTINIRHYLGRHKYCDSTSFFPSKILIIMMFTLK